MYICKWAALLFVFWLMLSGYIQPLLISFGALSVIIVLVALKRMDAVDNEPMHVSTGFQFLRYITWLLGEIVSSSVDVTKLIWGAPKNMSPSMAKISVKNVPRKCHVLYANSITLTPGTLSIDLDDDDITVHALAAPSLSDLNQGNMEQKITNLWGESK